MLTKLSELSYSLHQVPFPSAFISQSIRLAGFFFDLSIAPVRASERQIANGECEVNVVQLIHEIVIQFPR